MEISTREKTLLRVSVLGAIVTALWILGLLRVGPAVVY